MPFGRKAPPGEQEPVLDFDAIHEAIADAIESAGLEAIRADFETSGGFIHRAMFERLLLAEYVIADLTFANPNVAYEVGLRHGVSSGHTILIGAQNEALQKLPFDFAPFRVIPYEPDNQGGLSEQGRAELTETLASQLMAARSGELPIDNPVMQVTSFVPGGRVDHEKTDTFLHRMRYASEIGERVADALNDADDPVAVLKQIENEIYAGPDTVAQLHTALLAVYLGYRENKAYAEMVELHGRLPTELQNQPVANEQLALAYNRLAESSARAGDEIEADRYRRRALETLEGVRDEHRTSETHGILGRIYKGQYDAEIDAHEKVTVKANAMLRRAIDSYEEGFRSDPRDYYPGVNAVTLRLVRGKQEDLEFLTTYVPVVRFAVERAPQGGSEMERYWQIATKLELATAAKDWETAQDLLIDLIAIPAFGWMRDTTTKNMKIQRNAFHEDTTAIDNLDEIIRELGTN